MNDNTTDADDSTEPISREEYQAEVHELAEWVVEMLNDENEDDDPQEHIWLGVENSQTWRDERNHDLIRDECPDPVPAADPEQAARQNMEEGVWKEARSIYRGEGVDDR